MNDARKSRGKPDDEGPPAAAGKVRARRLLVWGSIAAAMLVVLVVSLVSTEQSAFCATCHEMRPYYDAWAVGGHARSAQCVDCHVDPGVVAHLAHKPYALKEVWDHFFTDVRFPNYSADVPSARCVRCHPSVPDKPGALYSHATHAKYGSCVRCHAHAGHVVSLASLQAQGVLKGDAAGAPTATGAIPSSVTSHIKVVCQECHDQSAMKCGSCHEPPHENRGDCSDCHQPGTRFLVKGPTG